MPFESSRASMSISCPLRITVQGLAWPEDKGEWIQLIAGRHLAQAHYEISKVVDASPGDFKPSPKVASRVLYFRRKDQLDEDKFVDSQLLLLILKQGFSQRRKKLVKNLSSLLPGFRRSLEELEFWLKSVDKTALARAEELSPDEWVQLCHWLKEG